MKVTKTINGDALTVAVEGWFDTLTAPDFHEAVQDLEGAKNVLLDLEGVEYISSAGLRETVALFRTVSANGGSFSVHKVNPEVREIFRLTGFDKKFEVSED